MFHESLRDSMQKSNKATHGRFRYLLPSSPPFKSKRPIMGPWIIAPVEFNNLKELNYCISGLFTCQ